MSIDKLYNLKVPEIQELFLEAMRNVVDRATLSEMIKAIESNNVDALFRASGFTPDILNDVLDKIEEVYKESAFLTVSELPSKIKTEKGNFRPVFNMRNPAVEKELLNFSSFFIMNISNEVRDNVKKSLEQGMIKGDNPKKTALNIVGRINPVTRKREGGIIGLTNNQTNWVIRAERYLEQKDNRYFKMGLRDKRFDTTVAKAFKSDKALTQDIKSKLLTAYKNKTLKYRAETISRTETMQAINRGAFASISQNINEGLIKEKQVKKWWDSTRDGRTRITHLLFGQKYTRKKGISLNEPFVLPTGIRLLYPGDSSLGADASEIINCRCVVRFKVSFTDG